MNTNYTRTQEEIVSLISQIPSANHVGGKYLGDCVCRIFMDFIGKGLPEKFKVVGPDVYIAGFTKIQFDFFIVERSAQALKYTNAYDPADIKVVVESKSRGFYGGRKDLEDSFLKLRSNWELIKSKHVHINFVYLTFQEAGTTKKPESINYWEETKKYLDGYGAFCLSDSRTHRTVDNEWENLLRFLGTLLG